MIGNVPIVEAILALAVGFFAALAGGAFGGVLTGGKALGTQLAAYMGSFYGVVAGTSGVLFGIIVAAFIG